MGKVATKATRKASMARTPEGQENYMINLSMKEAERRISNGTASSQIICHFLKLATLKEQLDNERLRTDLELTKAKINQINDQANMAKLQEEALRAFKKYSGHDDEEDDEYYED